LPHYIAYRESKGDETEGKPSMFYKISYISPGWNLHLLASALRSSRSLIPWVLWQAVEKALGDSMPHVKPEKKTIEKAIRAVSTAYLYILEFSVSSES
jgi:hypothetical protein